MQCGARVCLSAAPQLTAADSITFLESKRISSSIRSVLDDANSIMCGEVDISSYIMRTIVACVRVVQLSTILHYVSSRRGCVIWPHYYSLKKRDCGASKANPSRAQEEATCPGSVWVAGAGARRRPDLPAARAAVDSIREGLTILGRTLLRPGSRLVVEAAAGAWRMSS